MDYKITHLYYTKVYSKVGTSKNRKLQLTFITTITNFLSICMFVIIVILYIFYMMIMVQRSLKLNK